jgi:TMEM199 family protein
MRIDPGDYLAISLLAGTTSNPSAKLAPYTPQSDDDQSTRAASDRRAITALINGIFSVIGVGAACWWAGGSVGWPIERVGA